MEKIAWDGPKWGREVLFPANPDLADILGRTDLDFDMCFSFVGFQISEYPGSQISKIWPGPGGAWALGRVGRPLGEPPEWEGEQFWFPINFKNVPSERYSLQMLQYLNHEE